MGINQVTGTQLRAASQYLYTLGLCFCYSTCPWSLIQAKRTTYSRSERDQTPSWNPETSGSIMGYNRSGSCPQKRSPEGRWPGGQREPSRWCSHQGGCPGAAARQIESPASPGDTSCPQVLVMYWLLIALGLPLFIFFGIEFTLSPRVDLYPKTLSLLCLLLHSTCFLESPPIVINLNMKTVNFCLTIPLSCKIPSSSESQDDCSECMQSFYHEGK